MSDLESEENCGGKSATGSTDFHAELEAHRPELVRHCYRMMGSLPDAEDVVQDVLLRAWQARDSYVPKAPLLHWLMRIATNSCLKALASRAPRGLPQLDRLAFVDGSPLEMLERSSWVTPAPDTVLFPAPDRTAESRESVAIAFIALLQRLTPKQRASVLLKDVLGWSTEDIAATLELTASSVSNALHRARETLAAGSDRRSDEPRPHVIREYVRAWEAHDLESLVSLLKKDVVLAMPPIASWVQGADAVRRFLQLPRHEAFWSKGVLGTVTRANGLPGVAWYSPGADGVFRPHSLEVIRFDGELVAETIHFVGADYMRGFEVPRERRS